MTEVRMTKELLMSKLRENRQAFDAVIALIAPEAMLQPLPESSWSVKDNIAHITFYENQIAQRLRELLTGKPHFPALTDTMHWQKQNEYVFEQHRNDALDDVFAASKQSFQDLVEAVALLSEETLLEPQVLEGIPEPVILWQLLQTDVYEHYLEHIDELRTKLLSSRRSISMEQKTAVPFGTWDSPITPEMIGGSIRLNDVQWAPNSDILVWSQSVSGKTSLMVKPGADAPYDISGALNPAGLVGYGGGEFCSGASGVVFSEKNGRLYYRPYGHGEARPLTPAFGGCASPALAPNDELVLFVHTYEEKDVLALAKIDGSAWPLILAQGADFYMQPTWSPNGQAVAWVEWDHPNMPWDGTRLMFALFDPDSQSLAEMHVLDGNPETPTFQPAFSPDGKYLAYLKNQGEWDQLMLFDLETGEKRVLADGESLLPPAWVQGSRSIAWTPASDSLYYFRNKNATISLHKIDIGNGRSEIVELGPFSAYRQMSISSDGNIALIAESPTLPPRIIMSKAGKTTVIARSVADALSPEDLSDPVTVDWTSRDGQQVFGNYYPPNNRTQTAAGLPPVVVYIHGGPTSQCLIGFDLESNYFTSRGYGYFEINYRGSTGYGRAYREALRHRWGDVDLIDTIEGCLELVGRGLADPNKLIIKGGSAGGYTVLNALIHFPGFFKAGLCSYGVSNHFTMDMDTHKFEAHYNSSLIGRLPEATQRYHDWSPIFHADRIKDPIAIFQGSDDKVVPPDQSEAIIAALKSNKVPHTYKLYPGEGHGFRKYETLVDFYETIDRFLKQYVIFSK